MGYKVYVYICTEEENCGPIEQLVEYEDRDNDQQCPGCGGRAERTWQFSGPAVMRASFPDGKKRFDGQRRMQELRKAKSKARGSSDRVSEKKVEKEMHKLGGKK